MFFVAVVWVQPGCKSITFHLWSPMIRPCSTGGQLRWLASAAFAMVTVENWWKYNMRYTKYCKNCDANQQSNRGQSRNLLLRSQSLCCPNKSPKENLACKTNNIFVYNYLATVRTTSYTHFRSLKCWL